MDRHEEVTGWEEFVRQASTVSKKWLRGSGGALVPRARTLPSGRAPC